MAVAFIGVALVCVRTRHYKPEPQYQGMTASYWISVQGLPMPEETPPGQFRPSGQSVMMESVSLSDEAGLNLKPDRNLDLARLRNFGPVRQKPYPSREAFSAMGADGLEVLLRAMGSTNSTQSRNAMMLLGEVGPITPQVVNALVEASQTHEPGLHKIYRISWEHLGAALQKHLPIPDAPRSFAALYKGGPYQIDRWYLRATTAAAALAELASRARRETGSNETSSMKPFVAALRRLIAAASDKDDKVSNLAVRIIGFIGPDARAATPELIQNLQDTKRDPRVRQNIITGLSAIASHDSQTGQALINAAYDGDRRVRCAAVAALGRGGFAYKDAEPLLKVLLNDPDRVVAQLAYESLCQIEPENVRGVPVPTNPQISGAQMVVSSVFSTAYFMASMVSGTSDAQLLLMYSTNSTRRASGQLIH